ncbi:MAG: T9SS type A sorting domain-containing protein [Bacteroidia bacterium]|nr:T9SS type A sorting domain-containing protein [Bacteroidia bacterium]
MAQQGIVASGGQGTGAGGNISYSIGQTDYITISGIPGTITQGLQQPWEILVNEVDEVHNCPELMVFPNPTLLSVQINFKEKPIYEYCYRLYDLQGKLLAGDVLKNSGTTVNMEKFIPGEYLLRVFANNDQVKTFKIIKINK